MICKVKRKPANSCNPSVGAPSPERIKELTAQIRKTWSPKKRAARAGYGDGHVDTMVISVFEIGEFPRFHSYET